MRNRLSPDAWALAAIMLAVLLANLPYLSGFFEPNPLGQDSYLAYSVKPGLLGGRPTIDPNIGYSSQAIGHLAALDLVHLRMPWWNPYEVTGMPLLGETQSAALFPPTLLTAVSNGQVYEHILLELIAGVCTYLLLRRILVTRWAACAAGVAFALNGTFSWFAHATVNPVPFLPLLLLGVERAFTAAREGRRGGWLMITVAGALSIYGGFPEVSYISALVAVCWFGWRCGCLERRLLGTFTAKVALGGIAAALIATPVMLSMGDYLSHASLGDHASSLLGKEHLRYYALPQLLMPYVYGQVSADTHAQLGEVWKMVGGYLSTSLLLFAALGVFARGRRGLRLVVAGAGLLVFARMYGQPPVLGHLIGFLPDMSKIAFFRYGTSALELLVIVLAALGLDDLARVPEHRRRLLWGALVVLGLVVAGAFDARPLIDAGRRDVQHEAYFDVSIVWAALIPILAAAFALVRAVRVRTALLALLLALDAAVLFVVPELSAPRAERVDLAPVAYLQRHLGDSRFFSMGPLQPNYGSYFGLGSLNINDFPPMDYAHFVHFRMDPAVNPTLFVGNFGGWRPRTAPTPTWELVRHLDGYRAAGLRYVLAPVGHRLPQSPRTFTLVRRTPTTWIYRVAGTSSYFHARGCRVNWSGRENAHVSCRHASTLVRLETWLPGWSAVVDGHPTVVRRTDKLFQAVEVPAGSHRVSFAFAPTGIHWALLALLTGIALACTPWLPRGLEWGRGRFRRS